MPLKRKRPSERQSSSSSGSSKDVESSLPRQKKSRMAKPAETPPMRKADMVAEFMTRLEGLSRERIAGELSKRGLPRGQSTGAARGHIRSYIMTKHGEYFPFRYVREEPAVQRDTDPLVAKAKSKAKSRGAREAKLSDDESKSPLRRDLNLSSDEVAKLSRQIAAFRALVSETNVRGVQTSGALSDARRVVVRGQNGRASPKECKAMEFAEAVVGHFDQDSRFEEISSRRKWNLSLQATSWTFPESTQRIIKVEKTSLSEHLTRRFYKDDDLLEVDHLKGVVVEIWKIIFEYATAGHHERVFIDVPLVERLVHFPIARLRLFDRLEYLQLVKLVSSIRGPCVDVAFGFLTSKDASPPKTASSAQCADLISKLADYLVDPSCLHKHQLSTVQSMIDAEARGFQIDLTDSLYELPSQRDDRTTLRTELAFRRHLSSDRIWGELLPRTSPDLRKPAVFSARGGVLADHADIEKTLTVLSLVAAHREELDESPMPMPWVHANTRLLVPSRATLILCPSQRVSHWGNEAKKHFGRSLKVLLMSKKPQHQKLSFEDLAEADVVVVASNFFLGKYYRDLPSTFDSREAIKSSPSSYKGPDLQAFCWRRIVVDEVHKMIDAKKRFMLYFECLQSKFRWVVGDTVDQKVVSQLPELLDMTLLDKRITLTQICTHHRIPDDVGPFIRDNLYFRSTRESIGIENEVLKTDEEVPRSSRRYLDF